MRLRNKDFSINAERRVKYGFPTEAFGNDGLERTFQDGVLFRSDRNLEREITVTPCWDRNAETASSSVMSLSPVTRYLAFPLTAVSMMTLSSGTRQQLTRHFSHMAGVSYFEVRKLCNVRAGRVSLQCDYDSRDASVLLLPNSFYMREVMKDFIFCDYREVEIFCS